MKAKKLFALVLAVIMALGCMSVTVFADAPTEIWEDIVLNVYDGSKFVPGGANFTVNVTEAITSNNDANDLSKTSLKVSLLAEGNISSKTHHITKVVVQGNDLVLTNTNGTGISISNNTYTISGSTTKSMIVSGSAGTVSSLRVYYAPDPIPMLSFTEATTAPEFVEGTAKTASVGTVAAANFTGTVTYTAKVYTTADGTDEAAGITAAVDGTALKVTTTDAVVNGTYYVSLSGKYDTESDALDSRVPVKVYGAFLDLETDATYSDTATVDQLYDATVTANNTDVTKVQVSWKLQNIKATVTSNKIWNTETLTWDDDTTKTNGASVDGVEASFDFVNLSSVKIDAAVTFAVNTTVKFTAVTPTFTDDGEASGDGVITLGTKADGDSADNDGNITVDITPNADDFKDKTGTGTYGTYTVTIDRVSYAISASMTNATAAETNPTKIKEDGTATLVYTADATYALPDSVTVTGATLVSWDKSTGTLVIKNPTGAVTVSGEATSSGFAVSTTLTNATADTGNSAVASQSGTTTLVFNADSGYLLPTDVKYTDVISVSGATVESWTLSNNGTTGTLVISNPTANVSITLTGGNKPVVTPDETKCDPYFSTGTPISVSATGQNLTYQWYEYWDSNPTASSISGATTNACTVGAGFSYRYCEVSNEYGTTRSGTWYND